MQGQFLVVDGHTGHILVAHNIIIVIVRIRLKCLTMASQQKQKYSLQIPNNLTQQIEPEKLLIKFVKFILLLPKYIKLIFQILLIHQFLFILSIINVCTSNASQLLTVTSFEMCHFWIKRIHFVLEKWFGCTLKLGQPMGLFSLFLSKSGFLKPARFGFDLQLLPNNHLLA